jgi:predicted DNA-binding protein YlxM (UPF0122 family)
MLDYENFDESSEIDSSQEGDDSVNVEETEPQTEEKEEEKAETPEEKPADNEPIADYRPKPVQHSPETAKIIAQRKEIQRLERELKEREENSLKTNDVSLEELAEEMGVTVEAVKKLQKVLTPKSDVEEKLNAILEDKRKSESENNFKADFTNWAKGNADRTAKIEFYKTVAFNPEFLHLKTFDQMEKHFFPTAVKTNKVEGGTSTKTGAYEKIDFASMTDEQRERLYQNPKKQKEYFDWLDSQI